VARSTKIRHQQTVVLAMRVKSSAVGQILTEMTTRQQSSALGSVWNRFAMRVMTVLAGHQVHANQSMTVCQTSVIAID
jgi:hypothetical protein